MIHPLVRKELREHKVVLFLMWGLCALALPFLMLAARSQGTPLMAFERLVVVFATLLSLALANRFVVREYGGRTQLFLETLPVSRAQVIAMKWLTSSACLLLPMAACFGIILLVAADEVELTSRFISIVALRAVVFLLFFHALAMLIGLTGRYRYLIWVALGLLVLIADTQGQLPMNQWPPMLLVNNSMAFEREIMPVKALWITGLVTAVLVGGAFALALGFQGSWVVALSRRMTLREKVVAASVLLAVVYATVQVDARKTKAPFALKEALGSPEGGPVVKVARTEKVGDAEALQMAARIAEDLTGLRDDLALTELPVVAVLPDAALDADQFLLAKLPTSDGVVVRAAFGNDDFDEPAFRAFTMARVIEWYSRGRASREQGRWLLDGYSLQRVARDNSERRELLTLRAAVAADDIERAKGSVAQALQQWLTARELLGECLADALAWRVTEQLSRAIGDQRLRTITRARFGVRSYSGVGTFLTDASFEEQLREAGVTSEELAQQVDKAMGVERRRLSDSIANVQRWPVRFDAVPMRGTTYELRYDMSVPGKAPAYAVRYARLGPWEAEVSRAALERMDAVGSGVLPASFPRGTRLLAAVEVQDAQLGCAVRLGSRRWEVR